MQLRVRSKPGRLPRLFYCTGSCLGTRSPPYFGACGVRISQEFAGICRVKGWIFFVFRVWKVTLDQHIGVRIPGGRPIFMHVS
jgi:hypothetical protein